MSAAAWDLLGIRMSGASLVEITRRCLGERAAGALPVTVACANLHCLVVAATDPEFARALNASTYVTADGAPLRLAGRLLGEPVGPRITGGDVFSAMMQALHEHGGRAFFLGSTPAVLERIRARAAADYPAVAVGTLSPPFRPPSDAEAAAIVATINAFRPDVLWVGLSAPKQEKWTARNAAALKARSIVSIGAVFDFYAGTVRRAPRWMQRAGLEWLHRLCSEPRRLWRRYLVSGPVFLSLIWRDRRLRRQG